MKKIGFIGLGVMGKPMVFNLLKAGFSVYVLSASHSAIEVNQAGAILCNTKMQMAAEAFTLANKAGVDLVKMREVLLGGFAQSKILDLHGKRIIDRNFKPGFKIKLHKKDLDIALAAGEQHDVSLLGTAQVAAQMKKAIALGNGELDHSSLILLLQDSIK